MIYDSLFKSIFAMGIFFLMLTMYFNITKQLSDDKVSTNFLPLLEGQTEIYDEKIARIDNLKELKEFVNSEILQNNIEGIDIPIYIDDIIRKKYFHHTSYISAESNWILKVFDYLFPEFFFTTAMDPKDLVKKNHGICNQQAIMFQELVKDHEFEYASIGFSVKNPNGINFGHFASAVKIDESWFYFDSNMEPDYDRRDASIITKILNANKSLLKELYPEYNFDLLTKDMIEFRDLNTFPAKRGALFQDLTQFLSNFLWAFLFLLALLLKAFNLRKKKK